MSKIENQSKFVILALIGVILLALGQSLSFFHDNIILFLAIAVIILFNIKSRWLYFACLSLLIILPFLLFFFPDERINQHLGDFIYFFLVIGCLKQLLSLRFGSKNE